MLTLSSKHFIFPKFDSISPDTITAIGFPCAEIGSEANQENRAMDAAWAFILLMHHMANICPRVRTDAQRLATKQTSKNYLFPMSHNQFLSDWFLMIGFFQLWSPSSQRASLQLQMSNDATKTKGMQLRSFSYVHSTIENIAFHANLIIRISGKRSTQPPHKNRLH